VRNGTISIEAKVDAETYYDGLRFEIDGFGTEIDANHQFKVGQKFETLPLRKGLTQLVNSCLCLT